MKISYIIILNAALTITLSFITVILVNNYLIVSNSNIVTLDIKKLSQNIHASAQDKISDPKKLETDAQNLAEKILKALDNYSLQNNVIIFTNKQNIIGADDITNIISENINSAREK